MNFKNYVSAKLVRLLIDHNIRRYVGGVEYTWTDMDYLTEKIKNIVTVILRFAIKCKTQDNL